MTITDKTRKLLKLHSGRLVFLLSLFGVLLVCYSLLRLLFYTSNLDFFQNVRPADVVWAFVHGLRFDFTVLVQINSLFILLYSLPVLLSQNKYVQAFLKAIFIALNLFFFALSIADSQYFPYIQQRLSKDIIYLARDTADLFIHLSYEYWWFYVLVLFLGFLLHQLYIRLFCLFEPKTSSSANWFSQIAFCLVVIAVGVVAYRGGLQTKVLDMPHAQVLGNYKTGVLILNAPFTFISSFSQSTLTEKHYFQNHSDLHQWLQAPKCPKVLPPKRPRNIVIIILESFGAEFIGAFDLAKSYAPSFDSLAKEGGALFVNAYANAQRSIQSLPPLLASLPNWMKPPLIRTLYLNNRYPNLGQILKKRGYRTLFLHGGRNGTMYFDAATSLLGLDEYYGSQEYKESTDALEDDYDGVWGVFDEPFFFYSIDMINKDTSRPFFAVLFSLSSHHPFIIPEKYKGKFSQGETPFYESIGYTDYSLGRFFEKVKRQSWAKDTLFILTADHPPNTSSSWSQNVLTRRRIPILFYRPGHDLSFMKTDLLTQQLDIFPTVLDFLGIQGKRLPPFGRSLFNTCSPRNVVIYDEPNYWLISQKDVLLMPPKPQEPSTFLFKGLGLEKSKIAPGRQERLLKRLKAYVQHYNNGMLRNNLVLQ